MGFVSKVSRIHSWERETWAAQWEGALRPPGGTALCWGLAVGSFVCFPLKDESFCSASAAGQGKQGHGHGQAVAVGSVPGCPGDHSSSAGTLGSPRPCLGGGSERARLRKSCLHFFGYIFLQRCFRLKRNMKYAVTHQSFPSWEKALTWYESLTLTLLGQTSGLCTNPNWQQPMPLWSWGARPGSSGTSAAFSQRCPPSSAFPLNPISSAEGHLPSPRLAQRTAWWWWDLLLLPSVLQRCR